MRRANTQHGRARRRPWSVIVPSVLLVALLALLAWELSWALPLLA
jgi:hypothetical protein